MAIDISGFSYFMPIFGFLFVFVIVYALLAKTKILGDNKFINVLISFIISIIFSLMLPAQEYVEIVTPWFAILAISLFFILILIVLSQSKIESIMKPGFVWVFIIILILVFLFSAVKVFAFWNPIFEFIDTRGRVFGGILLLVIAGFVAWVITKK